MNFESWFAWHTYDPQLRPALRVAYNAGYQAAKGEAAPTQEPVFKHVCNLWINPTTGRYIVDHCDHPPSECIAAYVKTSEAAPPNHFSQKENMVDRIADILVEDHIALMNELRTCKERLQVQGKCIACGNPMQDPTQEHFVVATASDGVSPPEVLTPQRVEAPQSGEAAPTQEPDYFGLTNEHTWLSISKKQYDQLKPENRMACYALPHNAAAQIAELGRQRTHWEEEAKRYCQNADYWRERAESWERDAKVLQEQIKQLTDPIVHAKLLEPAPPIIMQAALKPMSDEEILELGKRINLQNEAMGFIWNQDIPVKYIQSFVVAFARALGVPKP